MTRRLSSLLLVALAACVHSAPTVQTQPPQKKTPVVIDIPRRQGEPVVVLPLRLVRAPLTAKERARLERWVARHLALQQEIALDVVSLQRLAAVREWAKQKRIAAEGPVCAAEPSLRELVARQWPDAVRAHPVADCSDEACRLSVSVERPGAAGTPVGTWVAEVPAPFGFEQWEEAAQALAPPKPHAEPEPASADQSPPVLERPGKPPEQAVALTAVRGSGPWKAPPTLDELQPWREAFAQCHERGTIPSGPDLVVLEIGADGKVAGCEGQSWRDPAERDQLRCHCEAAGKMAFDAGEEGRRLAIELRDSADVDAWSGDGARVTARIQNFVSSDPAFGAQSLVGVRPWLALCYATTRLRAPVTFPVQFEVSPTGEITAARIFGPRSDHVLGACVEGYLRYLPLPCTRSGEPATIGFEVLLERDQNEPTTPSPLAEGTTVSSTESVAMVPVRE